MTATLHTAAPPATAPKRGRGRRTGGALAGWLYATPTTLFVLLLFVLPLLLVLQMSASDWPLLSGNQGLNFPENYQDAVSNRFFWDSIVFTLKYTVLTTIILLALSLGLALLVQESSRWKGLLRTSFLIPSALGLASASLLFYVLYSPIAGPFADLMASWGFTFLGTPDGALWSTIFLIVWRYAGFYMLLMLVGLQGIPEDVYEAARIDGASPWQVWRRITLPLLRPAILVATVLNMIYVFNSFPIIYTLNESNPGFTHDTTITFMYKLAFKSAEKDVGQSAAAGLFNVLLILVAVLVYLRVSRWREAEES
jgi:multiple sugar transport system permease protein